MKPFQINLSGTEIEVHLENDYYGSEYWKRIESNTYEPDTQGFVISNSDSETDFMDIGAANGAMSILAALQGARVKSYEPDPTIFSVLKKNIESNPKFCDLVELSESAVSDVNSEILFQKNSAPEILSSIIFSGSTQTTHKVNVKSLIDEINSFNTNSSRRLVIKMDIEGAEWKILRNLHVLRTLASHNATLLLAVHPGFSRPMPSIAKKFLIARIPWLIMQAKESVKLHANLSKFATVKRTNLNTIENKFKFALLIVAGYHEFIINFN